MNGSRLRRRADKRNFAHTSQRKPKSPVSSLGNIYPGGSKLVIVPPRHEQKSHGACKARWKNRRFGGRVWCQIQETGQTAPGKADHMEAVCVPVCVCLCARFHGEGKPCTGIRQAAMAKAATPQSDQDSSWKWEEDGRWE